MLHSLVAVQFRNINKKNVILELTMMEKMVRGRLMYFLWTRHTIYFIDLALFIKTQPILGIFGSKPKTQTYRFKNYGDFTALGLICMGLRFVEMFMGKINI